MGYVLTEDSSVHCGHPAPPALVGGAVTLKATQLVLTVNGKAVLIGSLALATIDATGCVQQTPPMSNVPCSAVVSQSDGTSTVLSIGGTPVLLESASGSTNGKPLFDWKVNSANQAVLQAD